MIRLREKLGESTMEKMSKKLLTATVQRVFSLLNKLKGHMSKPEPAKKNDRDIHKF